MAWGAAAHLGKKIFGVSLGLAHADCFVGLIVSPHRGMVTTAPRVLFAAPGAVLFWKHWPSPANENTS